MPNVLMKRKAGTVFPARRDVLFLLEKAKNKFGKIQTIFSGYTNPVGLEIEVEHSYDELRDSIYWGVTHDGSLKDSGQEFISLPLFGMEVDYALAEIEPILKDPNKRWTHRTSIHVHQNLADVTENHVHALTSLYASVESLLFSLVDPKRQGGSYSYPLVELSVKNVRFFNLNMKYCAFNLGNSLADHCTVEYRHMHGTPDVEKIKTWILILQKLYHFVEQNGPKKVKKQVLSLCSAQDYRNHVRSIFGETTNVFGNFDPNAMKDDVLWAKTYLLVRGLI